MACQSPRVAGGWVGYVYVFVGCGAVSGLLIASTLFLYVVARVQKRRRPEARVSVTALPARDRDAL
jgi:hypothetical protein